MASSKAEYLKRYLAKPGDDDGGAKKKKRRKKEHGGHGHSKKPAGMRIFDDDAPAVHASSAQELYGEEVLAGITDRELRVDCGVREADDRAALLDLFRVLLSGEPQVQSRSLSLSLSLSMYVYMDM